MDIFTAASVVIGLAAVRQLEFKALFLFLRFTNHARITIAVMPT